MRVILFQKRFSSLVLLEQKLQTIRLRARCKPGDVLSLREWTGLPYRSKQWEIHRRICRAVKPIRMFFERDGKFIIEIAGRRVRNREEFAQADGFTDLKDMAAWFLKTHGMENIRGELIVWHKGKTPESEGGGVSDTKQIHIDTVRFKEALSHTAPPDEDHNSERKTEIARMQLIDHLGGHEIKCAKCELVRPLHSFYRCRFCGVWYCAKCSLIHFGKPQNEEVLG